MNNASCRALAASLVLCLLAACSTTPAPPPPLMRTELYRIGPPDALLVTVLPEPVIEREVLVRPDGRFSFDLVGDVVAAGRTADEIAEDMQDRLQRYKRDARVSVHLAEVASPTITMLGQVAKPGVFPLSREMRISEALGLLGGTTNYAKTSGIRVIRTVNNRTTVQLVDLGAIKDGDLRTDIQLAKGDLVVVPPHAWAQFGFFMQILLFPFQPLLAPATTVLAISAL